MRRVLEWSVVTLLIVSSLWIVFSLYGRVQPLGMDFAPIWAAAPSFAYDAQAVTAAHPFPVATTRPFAYPPTALLLFTALRFLSFEAAYLTFAGTGLALFLLAAIHAGSRWWVGLAAPVLLLAHTGQASLLVGGLLLIGLSFRRFGGLFFGLAIAIKPQLCLLLPVALILDRDWRGLASAVAVLALLSLTATASFGLSIWKEWLSATAELQRVVADTPTLSDDLFWSSQWFLPVSLFLIWTTRHCNPPTKLAAIVGGALLVIPYAVSYELALLIPAFTVPILMPFAVLISFGFYLIPSITLLTAISVIAAFGIWRSSRFKTPVSRSEG